MATLTLLASTSMVLASGEMLTQSDSEMLFGSKSETVTTLNKEEMKETTGKAMSMPEMPSIGAIGGVGMSMDMPEMLEMPKIDDLMGDSMEMPDMPEMPSIGAIGGAGMGN